jgi:hypothetical protein
MTNELQAATERLRRVHQGESVEAVYGDSYTTETQEHHYDHPYHIDLRLCLGQFLAEHPADDGEAITEEWLRSVGFEEYIEPAYGLVYLSIKHPQAGIGIIAVHWPTTAEAKVYWSANAFSMPTNAYPNTRCDARRLGQALGVPLTRSK